MDTEQIIQAVTTIGIPFGLKIIAIFGDGPIIGKTDGVVAYESAHIEGVASELVVRSGHSPQGHPETTKTSAHSALTYRNATNFRSFVPIISAIAQMIY